MTRHLTITLVMCAALAGAVADAARADGARRCGDIAFAPASDAGAWEIRADRVSCRTARSVAAKSRSHNVVDGPRRYAVRGFRCHGRQGNTVLPSVIWRCRRSGATVRFSQT